MRVDTYYEGPNYVICDSVEEYIQYEQHPLNVARQIHVEDMKVENTFYCNVVTLNYVCLDA
jgi:hypothetical protein